MILEQEVKILNIDVVKVVTKLLKYHAKRTFSGFITDTAFAHPTKKFDFSLRIRKKNASHYVTFKKRLPSTEYKKALEVECKLHEPARFLKKIQEQ
jgi:adenylate cyclase class IV